VLLDEALPMRLILLLLPVAALHQGARQVKWPGCKIHALAPPCLLLCFGNSVLYFDSETVSGVGGLCFEGDDWKRGRRRFWGKSASDDLAWGFSDLELTWLLYCAGAGVCNDDLPRDFSDLKMTRLPWRPGAATDCFWKLRAVQLFRRPFIIIIKFIALKVHNTKTHEAITLQLDNNERKSS